MMSVTLLLAKAIDSSLVGLNPAAHMSVECFAQLVAQTLWAAVGVHARARRRRANAYSLAPRTLGYCCLFPCLPFFLVLPESVLLGLEDVGVLRKAQCRLIRLVEGVVTLRDYPGLK